MYTLYFITAVRSKLQKKILCRLVDSPLPPPPLTHPQRTYSLIIQIFDRAIGQDDFSYTLKQDLPVACFTYQDIKSREEIVS